MKLVRYPDYGGAGCVPGRAFGVAEVAWVDER
jgi:hypothetical protein